ncbi:MAG: hypothetical protein WBD41_03410 [Rhodococcus sp. (in: high G+C Gram-positive bacteria)]
MKGQNVCKNHGGAAPQARAKAAERILLAQDLAAAKLVELMRDPSVPPGVQRMAAADLLDRGGNVAAHVLAIPGLGNEEPWQVVFSGMAGGSRTESRALRGIEDNNAGVLDAEVVALDAEDAPLAMLDGAGNGSAAATPNRQAPQRQSETPEQAVSSSTGAGSGTNPHGTRQSRTDEMRASGVDANYPPIVSLDQAHPDDEPPRRIRTDERNRAITPKMTNARKKRRSE